MNTFFSYYEVAEILGKWIEVKENTKTVSEEVTSEQKESERSII